MEQKYSMDEILSAVKEICNKKKGKKNQNYGNRLVDNDYSTVPKNTIRLIEEAEKLKN